MKNIKKVIIVLITVIFLAGCGVKEQYSLKIQSDKKVNLDVKVLMDNETIDSLISMNQISDISDFESYEEKTYTDEDRWKFLEENVKEDKNSKNYKYEKISEGDYKGYRITVGPTDIDSITGTGDKVNISEMESLDNNSMFTKADDVYTSNLVFNMDEEYNVEEYTSQMDFLTILFEVTLPNPSISNNADKVSDDGLTLTWDLSNGSNKNIDFSFKFDTKEKGLISNKLISKKDSTSNISIVTIVIICASSLLGIGIIVLIIVLIVKSSNKKKIKDVEKKQE